MTPLLRKSAAFRGQATIARPRWFVASSDQVKAMFGLRPEAKWPREGMAKRVIQGVTVVVDAIGFTKRGRKPHRVIAVCPVCAEHVSLGRLGQHLSVHPDYEAPNA